MQKSLHIELIATDGSVQKRILWAHSAPNGVYCGSCSDGQDTHVTYHADGNVFNNFSGKTTKAFTSKTFKEFTGHQQLLCSGFTNDMSHLHNPLYKLKKLDAIVSVDLRNYKKGVGWLLFLVEANFTALADLVKHFQTGNQPQITEIHSFMECNPWLAIVLCILMFMLELSLESLHGEQSLENFTEPFQGFWCVLG